jgi:peptidoglycan hydrolase-like protein with peptidoglycan-binding domain
VPADLRTDRSDRGASEVSSAVEILAAGNIVDPASVIRIAAAADLELAAAATLLQMESAGGKNIWGHDAVDTGGAYVKGSAVTREAYTAYLAIRGRLGAQGVGPCQLTWGGFQDRADRLGGCWRWDVNCRVGFEVLADLIRRHGTQVGFQRYNGSGPAAVAYGQKALRLYDGWRAKLGDTPGGEPARGPWPTIRRGDTGTAVGVIQRFLGVHPVSEFFGPLTEAAVKKYQAMRGLEPDGVVGRLTWTATGL